MSETRVVEVARVRAMVKRVHMSALAARFMTKKKARRRKAIRWFCGERWRKVERWVDQVEVRAVVVLGIVINVIIMIRISSRQFHRGGYPQLRKHAIDRGAGPTGGGDGDPRRFERVAVREPRRRSITGSQTGARRRGVVDVVEGGDAGGGGDQGRGLVAHGVRHVVVVIVIGRRGWG